MNDALVLVGVPVLVALARRAELPPRPLLLTLAFAVTVGSVAPPIGNPQNLLIAASSGSPAPFEEFLRYLLAPVLVTLLVGSLFLRWALRRESASPGDRSQQVRDAAPPLFLPGDWWGRLRRHPVLWVFPATLAATIVVDIASLAVGGPSVPLYALPLAGAALVLAVSRDRRSLLAGVNWSILLLFVGLFVVIAAAVAGGVIGGLASAVPIPPPSAGVRALPAITLTSLLGPQLFSNVPWVALQIPVFHSLGYGSGTPIEWMALAAASTLAGNLTILGAASNIILLDRAERLGVHISLGEFIRLGLPLTLLSVGVVVGCLAFGL